MRHRYEYTASAPGKTIISGEHAVVYGATALACAISLRTNVSITVAEDPAYISLISEEVLLARFSVEEVAAMVLLCTDKPPEECITILKSKLRDTTHVSGIVLAFYLCCMPGISIQGCNVCVTSELPTGAGMGSSAAYCTALSALLLQSIDDLESVNYWSYMGECIIHCKPSGVDNTVSVYGGSVVFKHGQELQHSTINYSNAWIIDSQVSRVTAAMVESVAKLRMKDVDAFKAIIAELNDITLHISKILASPIQEYSSVLEELFIRNQELLATGMSVSHPTLDQIIMSAHEQGHRACKLTGAGGGGCVLLLINPCVPLPVFPHYPVYHVELGTVGVSLHLA